MFSPADENTRSDDAMNVESKYAHGLLMYGYDCLPYMLTTSTDVATDDAVTNVKSSVYVDMINGAWEAGYNPVSQWNGCKAGIQYVNLFLQKV